MVKFVSIFGNFQFGIFDKILVTFDRFFLCRVFFQNKQTNTRQILKFSLSLNRNRNYFTMKTAKKDKDKDKKGRNTWRSADVKLRAIKLSKSGKSRSEIAKEMNISYMTVKNWLQNESKIVQHIENSPDISTTKITKSRPAILEKLEKMLFVWIEDCNNNLKFPLSQALIQEKALRIFEKLKEESEENVTIEFLASRG